MSLLQGAKLSHLAARQPAGAVASYVTAQRAGMEWLLAFCDEAGVDVQRRDAVTFAGAADELDAARAEHDLAREAGLPVS